MNEDRLESLKRWWRDVGNIRPGWITRDFEWLISEIKRLRGEIAARKRHDELNVEPGIMHRDATIATLQAQVEELTRQRDVAKENLRRRQDEDWAKMKERHRLGDELDTLNEDKAALEAQVGRLQKGNDQLRPFVLAILKNFGPDENTDLDYCKFQDLATQFKVIRWEKYDPRKHGEQYDIEDDEEVWLPDIASTPHSAGG